MTNLVDFSAYYLRAIWRVGDTDLETDLPRLIREAEARISRDLRETRLILSDVFELFWPASTISLPADFKELATISLADGRVARAVSPDTVDALRTKTNPRYDHEGQPYVYYSIVGNTILMIPNDTNPMIGEFRYYAGIAPLTVNTVQSFYDLHPDFFMAAVNVQVYTYLRDFDLSAEFNGKYTALLEDMRRQSHYTMFPSGQLVSPLSEQVR